MNLAKALAELRQGASPQREIIEGKDFYISYAVAGSGPTGDETALVRETKARRKFYILNGDWREQYRPLVKKGYRACKSFFDRHAPEHRNFWSD